MLLSTTTQTAQIKAAHTQTLTVRDKYDHTLTSLMNFPPYRFSASTGNLWSFASLYSFYTPRTITDIYVTDIITTTILQLHYNEPQTSKATNHR